MFERNRIDNVEHNGVPVEITTVDGEKLSGRVMMAMGRNFADLLNGQGGFIEFEAWGGERMFVAKATLKSVKQVQVPRPESLKARAAIQDSFDPHAVLGVARTATLADAKSAWHRLSKAYHPDRYANVDLPAEVVEYLGAMSRRVNAAFAALEAPLVTRQKAAAMRQTPVYESCPR